jgi:hypothetical protein
MNRPPRRYAVQASKPLSAVSAYKCEHGIEERCRCRCKGKFHGAKRKAAPRDDPHAAAFYCPCCGAARRLRHRNEWLYDARHQRDVREALRNLDPWRNLPEKPVARSPLSKEELLRLPSERLRKLSSRARQT